MPDATLLDLRGLRGRMRGCGDIPASSAKKNQPEASTLDHSYGLVMAIFSLQIPRLCKAGLGEVESCNYFSLRSSALQFLEGLPGFGPAAEVLLVRQKDPKPSDAPSGLMRGDGRQLSEGGPTRLAQTRSARESERPPVGQPAGVGPAEQSRTSTLPFIC